MRQLGSDNSEATTRKRQLGSDNLEATTRKRQLGSDNSEATTCFRTIHFVIVPYHEKKKLFHDRCFIIWEHTGLLFFHSLNQYVAHYPCAFLEYVEKKPRSQITPQTPFSLKKFKSQRYNREIKHHITVAHDQVTLRSRRRSQGTGSTHQCALMKRLCTKCDC